MGKKGVDWYGVHSWIVERFALLRFMAQNVDVASCFLWGSFRDSFGRVLDWLGERVVDLLRSQAGTEEEDKGEIQNLLVHNFCVLLIQGGYGQNGAGQKNNS
jgi:hypothetical protein